MKKIQLLFLILPLVFVSKSYAFGFGAKPNSNTAPAVPRPKAFNDNVYIVANNQVPGNTVLDGNVTENDFNGSFVELVSSPSSKYGYLLLTAKGDFKYNLFDNAPEISALKAGDILKDSFYYRYINQQGMASKAKLIINIIGDPLDELGNTILDINPSSDNYDNVDIEFNDVSSNATQVNSGRNIEGSLYSSLDKDWFALSSAGNEIISIELCPVGSVCYNKKNWVVYIFDSQKLTKDMESSTIPLQKWINDGSTSDVNGNSYPLVVGQANHMYLLYREGIYDGALVGVIDPCFGSSGDVSTTSSVSKNSVNIGVGPGARNYFIAVSSPLLGDGSDSVCGAGNVILTKPDKKVQVSNQDANAGPATSFKDTTREFISAFPYSDDQYAIKITGTGRKPL